MDTLSKQDLTHLLEARGDTPHVSIFLPTVRAGAETRQNPIRFKNLMREAEQRLSDGWMDRAPDIDEFLAPVQTLLDRSDFWQHQADGLAVFLAEDRFETYRVPIELTELVTVEDRFHLKPLFPLFDIEGDFYVLALSQNEVRLLRGDRYEVHEIQLKDVPRSLADALGHDTTEPQLQSHTGRTARATRSLIFHGHGAGEENRKAEIRKFFHMLDRGIRDLLGDEQSPLVLAGVDYLLPMYRDVTDYPHVADEGLEGNPEDLSAETLHERAWKIVVEGFRDQRREVMERYDDLESSDKASDRIDEVVPAAVDGRIETLFVPRGVRRWGTFDPKQRVLKQHDEQQSSSEDLLDLAAVHAFVNGGRVYAVAPDDMPNDGHVAAVFRY